MMKAMQGFQGTRRAGIPAALGAALLFGVGTPLAKLLLDQSNPWLLAGLLYAGSGLGLLLYRRLTRAPVVRLERRDALRLGGAILVGGIIAPVLLMYGLAGMGAAEASLLLNAEIVFTTLLAWFAFHENFDRRILLGVLALIAGALILSWPTQAHAGGWSGVAVLGACLAWAVDNNLTRMVAAADATWIACLKGLAAGGVNMALALTAGAVLPPLPSLAAALVVGCAAYGISLALFVVALRHLGTARTGAYFAVAPFFGAIVSIPLLHETLSGRLLAAGGCMAAGVYLHVSERHAHAHRHGDITHTHPHYPDMDHRHGH